MKHLATGIDMMGPRRSPDAEQPGGGAGAEPMVPPSRREASVRFEGAGATAVTEDELLDPANQSLADALRVMMRLLQVAMVVLGALYMLSGFRSVKENERGIRLLFGKVEAADLEPGFQWTAPFPLGDMIKVDRGFREVRLDRPFWVYVPEGTIETSVEKLTPTQSLKPDQGGSGSVITGDGNLAHTQWKAAYRREDALAYASTVLPSQEEAMVRAAIMRGIVQACGQITIDELLNKTTKDGRSVALLAKDIAQSTLNALNAGITIDQLSLDAAIPPLMLRSDFAAAQKAVADLGTAREQAQRDAARRLNEVAGPAAVFLVGQESPTPVVGLIDRYEQALARGDSAGAAEVLSQIDALMLGRPVTIDGVEIAGVATGEVTRLLRDAEAMRNETVSRARADLAQFQAKLAQFQANSRLMVQREWASAVRAFYDRPTTELMFAAPGTELIRLSINRDPALVREADRERRAQEAQDANRQREEQQRQQRFETNTLQLMPG